MQDEKPVGKARFVGIEWWRQIGGFGLKSSSPFLICVLSWRLILNTAQTPRTSTVRTKTVDQLIKPTTDPSYTYFRNAYHTLPAIDNRLSKLNEIFQPQSSALFFFIARYHLH